MKYKGEVYGVGNTNEAIVGVLIRPKHNSKVWRMLLSRLAVDYTIPGYRSSSLKLNGAHPKINSFVNACKSYEAGVGGTQTATNASGGISEKEAFGIAKEIGSVDGWNAFLKEFPTGFRADLARAFLKRLQGQGSTTSSGGGGSTTVPTAPAAPTNVTAATLPTVSRGPGTSRWSNRTQRLRIAGGQSVYTASVRVPGLEMVTYCAEDKREGGFGLGVLVRKKRQLPRLLKPYSTRDCRAASIRQRTKSTDRDVILKRRDRRRRGNSSANDEPGAGYRTECWRLWRKQHCARILYVRK